MEEYLIHFDETKDIQNETALHQYIIEKINKFAEKDMGCPVETYNTGVRFFMDDIDEQIKSGEARVVKHILPILSKYMIHDENEKKYNPNNIIVRYKDYDVYYVHFLPKPDNHYVDFFMATSDEEMKKFVGYLKNKIVERNKSTFISVHDGKYGQITSREKMERVQIKGEVFIEKNIKEEIENSISVFVNEDKSFFEEYNIPYKRGILLYGDPGNGKTSIIKSMVAELSHPVVYYQITEYTTSETLKEVFKRVHDLSPAIMIIEDIDSMPKNVRSSFLNILDGASSKEGICLIGTTNYPEKVDIALIDRAGRFDQAFHIKSPNKEMRTQYLNHTRMSELVNEDEMKKAIELTEGFSVVQLRELYTSVVIKKRNEKSVDIGRMVLQMKENIQKKKRGNWNDESEKVGF